MLNFHTDDRAPALHRRESLTAFLNRDLVRPETLSRIMQSRLSEKARDDYNRARLLYISAGITISTPQLKAARRMVRDCMSENVGRNSGHSGLVLDGPSTVGKTTTAKELMRYVWRDYGRQFPHFEEAGHLPVVYIEVPAGSTGKFLMKEFASFFGLNVKTAESTSSIRSRVVDLLNAAHTQLIVVDELHNLAGRAAGLGESVDLLKNLHNDLGATFVYAGIDLDSGKLLSGTRGQQLLGRFSFLNMKPLRLADKDDRAIWRALLPVFETELPLADHQVGSLSDFSDYLFHRTGGSIGSLSRLLTRAAIRAIEDPTLPELIDSTLMDSIVLDKAAEDFNLRHRRGSKGKPNIDEDFS